MDFEGPVWGSDRVLTARHSQDHAAARVLTRHWLQQRCRVATPDKTSIVASSVGEKHQSATKHVFLQVTSLKTSRCSLQRSAAQSCAASLTHPGEKKPGSELTNCQPVLAQHESLAHCRQQSGGRTDGTCNSFFHASPFVISCLDL